MNGSSTQFKCHHAALADWVRFVRVIVTCALRFTNKKDKDKCARIMHARRRLGIAWEPEPPASHL